MRRSRPAAVLALLAAATIGTSLVVAQAEQRSLYVSVLDGRGAPVSDIGPSDLIVREDNTTREVLRVARADEPMQIALVVDNSEEAEPYIRDYREALPEFIRAVLGDPRTTGTHQISLIALAARPTVLTDYTSDTERLLQGVQRIFSQSGTGTYLLDAIVEVSQGIQRRGSARPLIVAVTTEGPELSGRQFDYVLDSLRESGAAFHVVVVGLPVNDSMDRTIVLARGPKESGGSYDNLLTGMALTPRMKTLAAELTEQYRVTYARPETLIPPERVTVSAARPGITVRGTLAAAPAKPRGPR